MSFNVTMDGSNIGSFSPTSTSFSQFTTSQIQLTAGSHTLSFVGTGAGPDTSDFIDFVTLNNTSAQLPPSNISPPTIAGTPQVGQMLTGAHGSWTNSPTSYADQWYNSAGPISGAASLTYSPQTTDVIRSPLTLHEIATNAVGSSAEAISAATAAVTAASVPVNISVPTITGTPQVGQMLTGAHGSWTNSPTSYADQWYNSAEPSTGAIFGATSLTYSPQTTDVGSTLTLRESATNAAGSSAEAISAATARVTAAPASGIVNGSFEAPSIATYAYRPSSSWTLIGNAGIQHNGSGWGAPNAPDGVQTAFLQYGTNPLGNGTISQVFTVAANGTYSISFYSALRAYRTSPTLMSFNVTMDGTNIGSFSPTSTSFSQFTTSQIQLTAGSHTLSFVGTGAGPDTSDFIDFVTLNNTSASSCTDGIKNGTETDVDCGGSCPTKCANNKLCLVNTDCSSDNCLSRTCNPMSGSFQLVQGKDVVSLDTDGNEILKSERRRAQVRRHVLLVWRSNRERRAQWHRLLFIEGFGALEVRERRP